MALVYTPPGVDVQEFTSPSISPLLAVPASICLVGLSSGTITKTDIIQLNATTATLLPGVPTDATMASGSIVKVMDVTNPSLAPTGYTVTTDYTFSASNHQITRVASGAIPDGSSVYVTYTYTPADYWQAIRLDNMSDVEARFGAQYDAAGTSVNSPLSYAAGLAFENGASNVVLQPLFYNNAGVRTTPNATQAAAASTWTDNFAALRDYEDINLVVPVVGQSQANVGDSNQLGIVQALQDHIYFMKTTLGQYVIGVWGEDSSASSSVASLATLTTHASTIASRYGSAVTQHLVMVSPSKFSRALPASIGTISLGGQYVASAIAGMIAARHVSQSLTRQPVSGFSAVTDIRTRAQKNTDAGNGMLVVENKGPVVQIRHAITMDNASTVVRELSIVRSKHRVIESVRDTLENNIIGKVFADESSPLIVAGAVQSVLDALRASQDLVDYTGVEARTLSLDPTKIEVRFSYKPAFPINYISVGFSLDLTTGDVSLPSTTQVDLGTF